MKLYYSTALRTSEHHGEWSHVVQMPEQRKRTEQCCERMKRRFRPWQQYESGDIGWVGCSGVPRLAFWHGDADGEVEPVEIAFCPFCGAAVEFVEEGKVRAVRREVSVTRTETVYEPIPPEAGHE